MRNQSILYLINFFCLVTIEIYINSLNIENNHYRGKNKTILISDEETENENENATQIAKTLLDSNNKNTNKNTNKNKNKTKKNSGQEDSNIIKKVYSEDGENDNLYSSENPINGMDYWKSKKIKNGDYADWNIELVNNT